MLNKNTEPELRVKSVLRELGFGNNYEQHVRSLPGTPDFVVEQENLVIFVNGCFWHDHDRRFCHQRLKKGPKNRELWKAKFEAIRTRDIQVKKELEARGWTVLTIWECHAKRRDLLRGSLKLQLSDSC